MHIKLPGTADGVEVLAVCGRRCLREQWKKTGREREEEEKEKERVSRSREVLCLWKRGKHGDKGHRRRIRPWGRRQD